MKSRQVGGAWRAVGQLVGAVGDEGHGVEQALEGRGHGWNPAPGSGAAAGGAARGGGGRCCHDGSIGIDDGFEGTQVGIQSTKAADYSTRWSAEPCCVCAGAGYATDKAVPPGSRAGKGSRSAGRLVGRPVSQARRCQEVDPCCTNDAARQPDCEQG